MLACMLRKAESPCSRYTVTSTALAKEKSAASLKDIQTDSDMNLTATSSLCAKKSVMTKPAEIRDSPTVQLLNQEEEATSHLDGETLVELNAQLATVEDELRRLKPEYQAAKEVGDRELLRELRPSLETLMAERKLIKAVIAGEAELDELFADDEDEEEYEEEEESHVAEVAEDDDEDLFPYFVTIIDSFLGELPEDEVSAFTQSEGFEVYRVVASDPESASDDDRIEFFSVVDSLLGGMPDDAVLAFTKK